MDPDEGMEDHGLERDLGSKQWNASSPGTRLSSWGKDLRPSILVYWKQTGFASGLK